MALQTVLVLRADAQKLRTLFELPESTGGFTSAGAGAQLSVKLLEDGALVRTPHRFGTEPEALLAAVRTQMGRALALHEDARGLFIYPSVAEVTAADVEGVIDEVGVGGEWLAHQGKRDTVPPSAQRSPSVMELLAGDDASDAQLPDLGALFGNLGGPGGGLPDLGALAAQMGLALPDDAMAQISALLSGDQGGALMEAASRIAQGLSSEDLNRLATGDMAAVAGKAEALAAQLALGAGPANADESPDDDDDA